LYVLKSLTPAGLSLCEGSSSFLQSALWGDFKARFGWRALAFDAEWLPAPAQAVPVRRPLLVLWRALVPGISFAYVPWGPELPPEEGAGDTGAGQSEEREDSSGLRFAVLEELAAALRPGLPKDTAFIRFDPPWYSEAMPAVRSVRRAGKKFSRAAADVQPPDTVLVDLTKPEEELLAAMKNKWRYNIGLAEKKGVAVRQADKAHIQQELECYYRLYRETAARDGISIHGPDYYRTLFELAEQNGGADVRLYLASHEGEDIAGIVTLFRKDEGVYLYGASANHKRNLMAPYALQWEAMRDAKASGCLFYDMFGIPPGEDPDHPMAGLYRFKTGFGGSIIHRPGSWDYDCRPLAKALYSTAEKARKKLWDLKKRKKH
jgi:lipid II:glycine glycyltransferase (peptidoglycan interpeptide bridge formation enzyme)